MKTPQCTLRGLKKSRTELLGCLYLARGSELRALVQLGPCGGLRAPEVGAARRLLFPEHANVPVVPAYEHCSVVGLHSAAADARSVHLQDVAVWVQRQIRLWVVERCPIMRASTPPGRTRVPAGQQGPDRKQNNSCIPHHPAGTPSPS
eukprot:CAMPEP_0172092902 /NCGR_PEP_ID=MMETSP1043-20130122/25683_1 /TAXON_ID=464988 /ORGANISM="Hemiselmis andersenii, Strain CCMP441" /LENGTH=147 /DNA_ID=CAMNT_0012755641 /DNA_START=524 /DNA_END=965 /DNA_ORIENTATION=-